MDNVFRTETLLSLEKVSVQFGTKKVLQNVTVKIDNLHRDNAVTGQVVAFLGPSGAGKSTLLRVIAGLLEPTAGNVFIGADRRQPRAGLVGMVMQNNPLFRHYTVLENLTLAATRHRGKTDDAKTKSMALLKRFDMEDSAELYPWQLSGGMRQRAAISQQLLCSEHFLLMDEPFAALDPNNLNRACSLITEVASEDDLSTVIIVTHDPRAAILVADTLVILGGKPAGVVKEYDLSQLGLCWHPELADTSEFVEIEKEIRELFKTL